MGIAVGARGRLTVKIGVWARDQVRVGVDASASPSAQLEHEIVADDDSRNHQSMLIRLRSK